MGNTLYIDGRPVEFTDEKNVLEVVRLAGIELPTFCYHSELSVYGACRMCVVEVDGMGIVGACSTPPRDGMVVRTNTPRVRNIRRMALELLLANHDRECTTCTKSGQCKLQDLSNRFGIKHVRFGGRDETLALDLSSPSIVRDPNKCILCGDCVRVCREIQGIGVLDFAHRGSKAQVTPAFGKGLEEVDCVSCGQCAAVCPTAALTIKSETDIAWAALNDPGKVVIAQIAPAVRVAIGEMFGAKPGEINLGKLVSALRLLGFDKVFDTSFTADLTIMEETNEFVERFKKSEKLPQFTSCCPAWVKYVEQFHPELLDNLSSCRSPQGMFGALVKNHLAKEMNIDPKDIFFISIMPCTAKKFEAKRPEFSSGDTPEVDLVLTTQEIGNMIKEAGIDFANLDVEALDMPFGFTSGAGVIFGSSGGVAEASLRAAAEIISGEEIDAVDFKQTRGLTGLKEAEVEISGAKLKIAVVNGLKNAKDLIAKIQSGEVHYDLIEVMACPGGCIGGAGQPTPNDTTTREQRMKGLYEADKLQQLRKSQQNPIVQKLYSQWLGEPGSDIAHENLHTTYQSRRRIKGQNITLSETGEEKLYVGVCVGTSCYLKGSYDTMQQLRELIAAEDLADKVSIEATFCFENCAGAPSVKIGDEIINASSYKPQELVALIKNKLALV
ncbi:MAG: 2Fe-2S iron-sulfur cluster binding domain-containing protein [Firmicutes bacterium]|nr:2Fe-2S iron-sulfur cluster binding domain-containing protein [Bacillota bacterium]